MSDLDSNLLTIIIVNWNAGSQLAEAVSSIAQYHSGLVSSVVIVDNASSDDSLVQVELLQNLPFHLQIVRNAENRGFGAACNQGAKVCDSNYLLFLNPDTRLFEDSLAVPLSFMEDNEHQDVGICGIQLVDVDGVVSRTCYRFPTMCRLVAQATGFDKIPGLSHLGLHMHEWNHQVSREVEQVLGAFFLVRHALFKSLGGFDERFFVYFEEVDFSFCARKAGWLSYYIAETKAFHEGGGTTSQVKAARLFYSLRSRLLYCFKHFPLSKSWIMVGVTLFVEPVSRVALCLFRHDRRGALDTLLGIRRLWEELWKIYNVVKVSRGAAGE